MSDDDQRWAPPVLMDAGEDDTGPYVLGVRESTENDSWSLMFMECSDAEGEQEIALGMDTYCLVVDPGQATVYGGVLECELIQGSLCLLLTEKAAMELGTPTRLSFALAMSDEQVRMIGRGLTTVLTSGRSDEVPHRLNV